MLLENQVCSLELAYKLKELKLDQNSIFWWVVDNRYKEKKIYLEYKYPLFKWVHDDNSLTILNGDEIRNFEILSAFNATELSNLLPLNCITKRIDRKEWESTYDPADNIILKGYGKTEADSKGYLLKSLIESKIWKPE